MSDHPGWWHVLGIAGERALLDDVGAPAPVLWTALRKLLDARFPLPFLGHTHERGVLLVRLSATQYLCGNGAATFLLNSTQDLLRQSPEVFYRNGRGHLLTKEGEVAGECVRLSKLRMCACVGDTTWAVHIAADGVPVSTQLPRRFEVPASVACGEPRVCSQVVFMSQSVPDVPMWAGRMLWCASDLECHAVKNCAGALMLTVPASAAGALCANRVCWSPATPDTVYVFGFDEMQGCAVMAALRLDDGRWTVERKHTPLMWQEPAFCVQHDARHEIELRGLASGRTAALAQIRCDF